MQLNEKMSRLIVKGLPNRYDDSELRDLFKPLGEVTDARIMKTKDGKSRNFGFVGFRTKEDASRAKLAMHKAYVDTRPVVVETAHAKGDGALPRAWSRYTKGSTNFKKIHGDVDYGRGLRDDYENDDSSRGRVDNNNSRRSEGDGKSKKNKDSGRFGTGNDAEFEAFEEVASNKTGLKVKEKTKMVQSKRMGSKGKIVERKHVTFEEEDEEEEEAEDELYEELPKTDEKVSDGDGDDDGEQSENPSTEAGDEVALNETVSDMDYFKSKIVDNADEKDVNNSDESDDSEDDKVEEEKLKINNKEHPDGSGELQSTGQDESEEESDDDVDALFSNKNMKKKEHEASEEPEKEHGDLSNKTFKSSERPSDNVDAGETGRLLIRNLAFSVTEEELETAFEPSGALSEVHIVRDSRTNKSRGMGFIQFCVPEQAAKALMSMDGSFHCGRILHVLPARPKPEKPNSSSLNSISGTGAGGSTYKSERDQIQKEAARSGKDINAQHALHLSADAVAEIAAEQHGVTKAELLGSGRGESGIAAVRLAVAEATVQGEARAFLKENGINIEVLGKMDEELNAGTRTAKKKRLSRMAFLVKNLPARTTRQALMGIFSKFGNIAKLLVVPSGLLGVVQFGTASDARRAYNGLAYTQFRDTPLYLEWLPAEAVRSGGVQVEKTNQQDDGNVGHSAPSKHVSSTKAVEKDVEVETKSTTEDPPMEDKANGDDVETSGCSVYVTNLSFETRDKQLKTHFATVLKRRKDVLKSLRSAKVALKRGPEGKESEKLSMGFGFLEFCRPEDAREAVKIGQNTNLDGHILRLQLSTKRDDGSETIKKRKRKEDGGGKVKPTAKLMVRNVSFEATRKDVRQLFETFGQLKVVRMPQKMDGSHRGFGFVEYVSKNEAVSAYEALKDTHLYGRHLVIEFAKEEEGGGTNMAELQERASRDVSERKRRRVFNSGEGNGKNGDEKDDSAMMKDELYG